MRPTPRVYRAAPTVGIHPSPHSLGPRTGESGPLTATSGLSHRFSGPPPMRRLEAVIRSKVYETGN
jgi:hypothetical protein